jgi:hypothetical protein
MLASWCAVHLCWLSQLVAEFALLARFGLEAK